jgi:hypothetical protein
VSGAHGSQYVPCDVCQKRVRARHAKMCWVCWTASRPDSPVLCACGARRSFAAGNKCSACYRVVVRPPRVCEWCNAAIERQPRKRDAARFCSKTCSGALKTARRRAHEAESESESEFARTFQRELMQRLPTSPPPVSLPPVRCCNGCGVAITQAAAKHTPRFCGACFSSRLTANFAGAFSVSWRLGAEHICPNCGRSFRAFPHVLCCSARCGKQIGRAQERGHYPVISAIQLEERNRLAKLISLVREANRRLHKYGENEHRQKHK